MNEHQRQVEHYKQSLIELRERDNDLFNHLINTITKLESSVKELESNTLRNFSVYMQNNYKWLLGSIIIVGNAIAWLYTIYTKAPL